MGVAADSRDAKARRKGLAGARSHRKATRAIRSTCRSIAGVPRAYGEMPAKDGGHVLHVLETSHDSHLLERQARGSGYTGGFVWDLRNGWVTNQSNSNLLYGGREGGKSARVGCAASGDCRFHRLAE